MKSEPDDSGIERFETIERADEASNTAHCGDLQKTRLRCRHLDGILVQSSSRAIAPPLRGRAMTPPAAGDAGPSGSDSEDEFAAGELTPLWHHALATTVYVALAIVLWRSNQDGEPGPALELTDEERRILHYQSNPEAWVKTRLPTTAWGWFLPDPRRVDGLELGPARPARPRHRRRARPGARPGAQPRGARARARRRRREARERRPGRRRRRPPPPSRAPARGTTSRARVRTPRACGAARARTPPPSRGTPRGSGR
jgi:hypothetical protein